MRLETDQDTCYDSEGNSIACPGSGQDAAGSGLLDKTAAGPRFELVGDSVKDTRTGLVWPKDAGLSEFPLTWLEALRFVEQVNASAVSGEEDWRLPNRRELFSLVSHQHANPSLPQNHPFSDVFNGYYWTGTSCARLADQAWYVHLGGGRVHRGMKHGSYMVWPVRGQAHFPSGGRNRMKAVDGIQCDQETDRCWYADPNRLNTPLRWEEALDAVRRLNASQTAGYSDWRLPNIRELESLVDDRRHSPALVGNVSTGIHHVAGCWSSTTSVYEPRYAWVLYPHDGAIGVGFKAGADFHALAVRGPDGGNDHTNG